MHWEVSNALGGYHQCTRGCSVHLGISSVHWGYTIIALREYHQYIGGGGGSDIMICVGRYQECIRGYSVHWGNIMSALGRDHQCIKTG